jgi:hypothetical protein
MRSLPINGQTFAEFLEGSVFLQPCDKLFKSLARGLANPCKKDAGAGFHPLSCDGKQFFHRY